MAESTDARGGQDSGGALASFAKIFLRSKAGVRVDVKGDSTAESPLFSPSDSFGGFPADSIRFSADGSKLATSFQSSVTVRKGLDLSVLFTLDVSAKALDFSPKGSYLLTWQNWQKPGNGEASIGNLVIWDAEKGVEVKRLVQKQLRLAQWPSVKWSEDEAIAATIEGEHVVVFNGNFEGGPVARASIEKLNSFSVAPGKPPYSIATFVPEIQSKPAKIAIYRFKNSKGSENAALTVSAHRSSFQAQEISFQWSPDGRVLLGVVSTQLDATGQSYYGSSALVLVNADGSFDSSVAPPKAGAVHDVQWSPVTSSGLTFAVCAGSMPAQTALYTARGEQKFQFGNAPRNTVSWSPHGRFLCIAGFGNLAGEMDFWDISRLQLLGRACSSCSVKYEWSPDSRIFLTATCAPRMNVDNGIKLFRYNGEGPIHTDEVDTLYDAMWQPVPKGTFPDRPTSPNRVPKGGAVGQPASDSSAVKPQAYRPPGARGEGGLAAAMRAAREGNISGPRMVSRGPATRAPQPPEVVAERQRQAEKQKKEREEKVKADEERLCRLEQLLNGSDNTFSPSSTAATSGGGTSRKGKGKPSNGWKKGR